MKLFVLVLSLLISVAAQAQTDPTKLPLFDPTKIVHLGTIEIPGQDSRGNTLNYGAGAAGFSEDGTQVYVGCFANTPGSNGTGRGMIWTGTVPAIGGVSKEIAPCTGKSNVAELGIKMGQTDGSAYFPLFGGVIQKGGRMIVTSYITYDASGVNRKSWWVGSSFSQLADPVAGSLKSGLVMRDISRVPPEWQQLLGGDLGVTTGYTSIISRASFGPSFSTFWSKDVGTPGFKINFLLGCPMYAHDTGEYLGQCQSNYQHGAPPNLAQYGGSEQSAGVFMVPGTRTLVVLVKESKGEMCYGYATRDRSLHLKDHPGPDDAAWCYSLTDNLNEKGPKGYPYAFVALLYDANDLLAVKNGTKKPWDVKHYASMDMPTSNDGFTVGYTGSAAFNALTGTHYLFRELWPNGRGTGTVDVFGGFNKEGGPIQPPPTPVNCDGTWSAWARVAGSETQCIDSRRNYTETSSFTITTQPANGGTACPASPRTQTLAEDCVMPPPPPPPPPALTVGVVGSVYTCRVQVSANAPPDTLPGWGVQFRRKLVTATTWTNYGSRDTSEADGGWTRGPFTVSQGEWQVQGVWTRTGSASVTVNGSVTYRCE